MSSLDVDGDGARTGRAANARRQLGNGERRGDRALGVDHLPAASRDIVASLASGFDEGALARIVGVVRDHDVWSIPLPLVALDPALQQRLVPWPRRSAAVSGRRWGPRARELGVLERLGPLGTLLA
ncbi:MAG: hypothetical protein M3065_01230 [Actinomycetota bacterium]|nr:hypothetical protein [Actinomycetota bacterium]